MDSISKHCCLFHIMLVVIMVIVIEVVIAVVVVKVFGRDAALFKMVAVIITFVVGAWVAVALTDADIIVVADIVTAVEFDMRVPDFVGDILGVVVGTWIEASSNAIID